MNFIIISLQKTGLFVFAKKILSKIESLTPAYKKKKKEMYVFYSNFIHNGDLCFDIGANIGNRTEIFRELGATVIAVEPQPNCLNILKRKYGQDKRVIIVPKALGANEGEAEMMVSDASTISSMSSKWIDNVKKSGRFSSYVWNRKIKVPVTTFDTLINKFGKPVFCKIDVEGFESEVLKGLTKSIGMLSFEFIPEFIEPTVNCINHIVSIGNAEFNYSEGESMKMAMDEWVASEKIIEIIENFPDKKLFGDIYARFIK